MNGVPVKPMQSKLKTTSIELTERDLSRTSMRRRMISYRKRVSPSLTSGCLATSAESERWPYTRSS